VYPSSEFFSGGKKRCRESIQDRVTVERRRLGVTLSVIIAHPRFPASISGSFFSSAFLRASVVKISPGFGHLILVK
jgi:hypothetical protein